MGSIDGACDVRAKGVDGSGPRALHGQVLNINDVITFQGTSVEELGREFAASVDDYLAWCEERGEPPEKPYSGRLDAP